jgi:hypothetical protein
MTGDVWRRLAGEVRAASARARKAALNHMHPDESCVPVANIAELYKLRRLVDELIDAEIIRGRAHGVAFDLLGNSRQQAQQRHARAVRQRELTKGAARVRHSVNGS